MDNPLQTSFVDTGIKEIESINCIEASPEEHIAYVAGKLTSRNARQSCPVVVIDLFNNYINCKSHEAMINSKDILETRNTEWITGLKRVSFSNSIFLAVGGDRKILDLFFVQREQASNFKMSKSSLNQYRPYPLPINSIKQSKRAKKQHLPLDRRSFFSWKTSKRVSQQPFL